MPGEQLPTRPVVAVSDGDQMPRHVWDNIEQGAKVLSLVAIPVVLAIVGWLIQDTLAKRSVGQEYVKLAVSLLTESKEKADPLLREWAVDLLNTNSPVKFSSATAQRLKAGEVRLPDQISSLLSGGGSGAALVVAPDARTAVTGHTDGTARVWELATGRLLSHIRGHTDAVTSLAFSPDARKLLTGSMDNTARLWDVSTGALDRTLAGHTAGVIGVAFTPDGSIVLTRSLDGTVNRWKTADGSLVGRIRLPQ